MTVLYGAAAFHWNDHNLLDYSEDFSEWTNSGTVITAGEDDPYGGTNARAIEDDNAGAQESLTSSDTTIHFQANGQKVLACFIKEGDSAPAGGSMMRLYDSSAVVTRAQMSWTWSSGEPVMNYAYGTELFVRPCLDGWYRVAVLSTPCVAGNNHRVNIFPALTAANTGDCRFFGASLVDGAVCGGYVRTIGTALAYDGSAAQYHNLRIPLQKILPAGRVFRVVRESADLRVREVTTVGAGVAEITAQIRYDEDPDELNELIRAGVRGFPLVYVPDTTDLDDVYEFELIEPGADWVQQMEADWVALQETMIPVRLRRMDGGSLAGLF